MGEKIFNKKGEELITLGEAEKLGYANATTLKERIKTKKLKGIKIAKTWLVVKEDVRKQSKN